MSGVLKVLLGVLGGTLLVLLLVAGFTGGGLGGSGSMMSGAMMGGGILDMLFALLFWALAIALLIASIGWMFVRQGSDASFHGGDRDKEEM